MAPVAVGGELEMPVEFDPVGEITQAGIAVDVDLVAGAAEEALGRRLTFVQERHLLADRRGKLAETGAFTILKDAEGRGLGGGHDFTPDEAFRHPQAGFAGTIFRPPDEDVHDDTQGGQGRQCQAFEHDRVRRGAG